MLDQKKIRNFSIIAHIDHGKSTLADRLLEITHALKLRKSVDRYLDKMDLEKEKGITIKAQSVRMNYVFNGEEYTLNLIDTPGHVDFTYEVSRSLAACEGALLVVDATQGVQAQTLANSYLAVENDLVIIPVLNKIDLQSADVETVKQEISEVIGIDASDAVSVSAKSGQGANDVLANIIELVPPPSGKVDAPLRALIFDCWFDNYVGVVSLLRIVDGEIKQGQRIQLMSTGKTFTVDQLGFFGPDKVAVKRLGAGEVGFITASIKQLSEVKIGDTVTDAEKPAAQALPGFVEAKPMVFCSIFPTDSADYPTLKDALEKLVLNDSSFTFEAETSPALGFGFRCGFLGSLHMEITQERLEREFDLSLISTAPSVRYRVRLKSGEVFDIDNPSKYPSVQDIDQIMEPRVLATIHIPAEFIGAVFALCEGRRGRQKDMEQHGSKAIIRYDIPLSEMVFDFHDRLKSATKGYASMDYELIDYETSQLVKLDILVNGDPVDALSVITHKDKAYRQGRELAAKMRALIHRQMFEVVIQAAIGTKILARETVKAIRKNVTAKCYGGDISRKRKLLEKQKEGKKRMKRVGSVDIPQEAFLAILKVEE